jgi:hypothetical protein
VGSVRVPEGADVNKAKFTLSYPDWKEGNVQLYTVEAPIMQRPAAK